MRKLQRQSATSPTPLQSPCHPHLGLPSQRLGLPPGRLHPSVAPHPRCSALPLLSARGLSTSDPEFPDTWPRPRLRYSKIRIVGACFQPRCSVVRCRDAELVLGRGVASRDSANRPNKMKAGFDRSRDATGKEGRRFRPVSCSFGLPGQAMASIAWPASSILGRQIDLAFDRELQTASPLLVPASLHSARERSAGRFILWTNDRSRFATWNPAKLQPGACTSGRNLARATVREKPLHGESGCGS
jgi:hypothetical protein